MVKERIKVVQRKAKPHILHEQNGKGQHRLVLVGEESNETSRWFEHHQVGEFNGLYFNKAWPLPSGVFRAVAVEHRQLHGEPHLTGADVATSEQVKIQRPPRGR